MPEKGRGCLPCGEDQRRIKELVKAAARTERAGKSVAELGDQVAALKTKIASCRARGHTLAESRHGAQTRWAAPPRLQSTRNSDPSQPNPT